MPEEESGLDELLRLNRQFAQKKADDEKAERQRIEQGKKVKGVLQGLKDLNINMALGQLKGVADPATVKRVERLKTSGGSDDLRKLITTMADDMERLLGKIPSSSPDAAVLVNNMRTLNILMDLYFSLQ